MLRSFTTRNTDLILGVAIFLTLSLQGCCQAGFSRLLSSPLVELSFFFLSSPLVELLFPFLELILFRNLLDLRTTYSVGDFALRFLSSFGVMLGSTLTSICFVLDFIP